MFSFILQINKLFQGETVSCTRLFEDMDLFCKDIMTRTVKEYALLRVGGEYTRLDMDCEAIFRSPSDVDFGAVFELSLLEAKLDNR